MHELTIKNGRVLQDRVVVPSESLKDKNTVTAKIKYY